MITLHAGLETNHHQEEVEEEMVKKEVEEMVMKKEVEEVDIEEEVAEMATKKEVEEEDTEEEVEEADMIETEEGGGEAIVGVEAEADEMDHHHNNAEDVIVLGPKFLSQ